MQLFIEQLITFTMSYSYTQLFIEQLITSTMSYSYTQLFIEQLITFIMSYSSIQLFFELVQLLSGSLSFCVISSVGLRIFHQLEL